MEGNAEELDPISSARDYLRAHRLARVLSGLGNGLATLAAATVKNMDADFFVFEYGSRASMAKSLLPDLSEELLRMPKVQAASPLGVTMTSVMRENGDADEEKVDVAIIGIVPDSFLTNSIAIRMSCRGAKRSASPSPERWSTTRASSWPMSPLPAWIPRGPTTWCR